MISRSREWQVFNKFDICCRRPAQAALVILGLLFIFYGLNMAPARAQSEGADVQLSFPPALWLGDEGTVQLALTAQRLAAVRLSNDQELIDLFDDYQVVLEARLELAGMAYAPVGSTLEPISPGTRGQFQWRITADHPGAGKGTLWVHLRLLPKGGGSELRLPVYAFPINIAVKDVLGIQTGIIRGLLAGVALLVVVFLGVEIKRGISAARTE